MSLPEVLLWRELRKGPAGLKFRRQHPAGPYVADFFCHEARLVIEVDGEAHERGDRPARDEGRDAWFAERQFRVLRIPAAEVLSNLEGVIQWITGQANSSPSREVAAHRADGGVSASADHPRPPTPLHRLRRSPTPQGEDLKGRCARPRPAALDD